MPTYTLTRPVTLKLTTQPGPPACCTPFKPEDDDKNQPCSITTRSLPATTEQTKRIPAGHRIPPELLRLIFNFTQDYELCTTLHVSHDIEMTAPWTEQSTPLDRAILTSSLPLVKHEYFVNGNRILTSWGARAMLRFAYVFLLDFLMKEEPSALLSVCSYLLPTLASAWGRVTVLDWAIQQDEQGRRKFPFDQMAIREAMDEASRHGHVDVLEWWKEKSGCTLQYSEDALSSATFTKQIAVLEWWKHSGLPLKVAYVLDFASMEGSTVCLDWWSENSHLDPKYSKSALYKLSCTGNISLLNWWRSSKFRLMYDKDAILGATKHGQVEALNWWVSSGLTITFRPFDIEEAIEDAVSGHAREVSEEWWKKHGLLENVDPLKIVRLR